MYGFEEEYISIFAMYIDFPYQLLNYLIPHKTMKETDYIPFE